MAGAAPTRVPVTMQSASMKPNTRQSSPISCTRGRYGAADATSRFTSHQAISSPAVPPVAASSRLSARNWRTRREGDAPIAARTATSRCRNVIRASERLATFAHASASTIATAPNRTNISRRTATGTTCCDKGTTAMPRSLLVSGYCACRPTAIAVSSACAAASDTPGFSRPVTLLMLPRGRSGRSNGSHRSVRLWARTPGSSDAAL